MQLKHIANMEKYLLEDCYCPGEIYDSFGLFCKIFKASDECVLLSNEKIKNTEYTITYVVCKDQILEFLIDSENNIISAKRNDATENNIREIINYLHGKSNRAVLDKFIDGETTKSFDEIVKYVDAIMVS